jgi:transcriptional regulator with XRE-family HTH domain
LNDQKKLTENALASHISRETPMGIKNLALSVGMAIARERKLARMTQAEVADKLRMEKESISRLETGATSPTLTRLQELSEVFGCPVGNFFWQESGDVRTQSETLADMIRTLPEEKRGVVMRLIADVVRVLR